MNLNKPTAAFPLEPIWDHVPPDARADVIGEQSRRAKTQNAKDNSHNGDVEGLLPLTNFPNVFHIPRQEAIQRLAAVFKLKERPIQSWQYRAGKKMVSGAEAEHIHKWEAPPEPVRSLVVLFYGLHMVEQAPAWPFSGEDRSILESEMCPLGFSPNRIPAEGVSPLLKAKAITVSAVVIAVLFGGLLLVASHHPCSPITVRHVNSVKSMRSILTWFHVTNHTANPYAVLPLEVEVLEDGKWQKCFSFVERLSSPSAISPLEVIGPHGCASHIYELTNLPQEVPLRFRFIINQELTGVPGFCERLKERYWYHHSYMSLNPSDRYTFVFDRKACQITSQEFIEPKR